MTGTFLSRLGGGSLTARAARSAMLTVGGFGASQALRLASNLILTRLLFPEAFGMMALIMVILQGLNNFSDVGTTPAILQSKRGDDPAFLNTAWTINIMRGFGLWLFAAVLAWPLAHFYGEPLLAQLLPVAALTLIISGFNPTRMDTANRHLSLGRITAIELGAQVISLFVAILLAWWLHSVWALVISGIVGSLALLALTSLYLPGGGNRLHLERAALDEFMRFGKWVFLATVCGFFISQGDKIVLGKLLPLDTFGIYNIGFFLASFPLLMGGMVTRKILIPIYREAPPSESRANFLHLRRMRVLVTALMVGLVVVMALAGPWLVGVLYDPRYHLAGAVVVIVACAQLPQVIALTYDQAALAAGDSKRFFVLALVRAVSIILFLLAGFHMAGLPGALVGVGVAYLLAYPVVVWLARHQGAWDPLHDAGFATLCLFLAGLVFWVHDDAMSALVAG